MGGHETMTKERFTIESDKINSTYSIHIRKDGKVIFEISNWDSLSEMHKTECEEIVDLLNEQDQKIKETKDMFYEVHKQQQDCLKEVIKLKEEKRELEFKLGTLIKAYSRNNCAFNGKETEYLKSLRE